MCLFALGASEMRAPGVGAEIFRDLCGWLAAWRWARWGWLLEGSGCYINESENDSMVFVAGCPVFHPRDSEPEEDGRLRCQEQGRERPGFR